MAVPETAAPRSEPASSLVAPVDITIRFASDLPDLRISIPNAHSINASYLKKQIRTLRLQDLGRRRLRLIYAGRVLVDHGKPLGEQIRIPSARKPQKDVKGKKKLTEHDGEAGDEANQANRVYIHCAVGEEMTDEDLQKEGQPDSVAANSAEQSTQPPRSTLPQPLGFDRLLSAGFTEADISALRAQFNRLNNISADAPPETARLLEERWIDEAAGAGAGELADGSPAGTYEDMFFGVAIGFFWPVAVFALREEGIFSKRRGIAIIAGLLVNLLVAALRISS